MSHTHATIPAVAPLLAGATATVSGSGAAAEVLRIHLDALGAAVTVGDLPRGVAATAHLALPDGTRRELTVDWAGPVAETALTNETAVQAICGVMHVNGRRAGRPRGLSVDYCETAAGALAGTALLASLLTAPGGFARVETSVAEAALLSISQYLAAAGADDPEAVDLAPGGPPFTSADGIRFEIESLQPEPWGAFWTELGAEPSAWRKGWRPFQFRYATATAPLAGNLHDTTRAHTFDQIRVAAAHSGVQVCRLYSAAETGTPSPQSLPAPWTVLPVPNSPFAQWDRCNGSLETPLSGLVVLEAGRRVQAPLAAHLLRLLGADVTRIEPPGGDPLREMPPCSGDLSSRWLALNRRKRAAEFDIKSTADRKRLRALAAESDVFLHNWAPGKAELLKLSAADMPPGVVHVYTSGWSGLDLGDLPPGTDFMVQARTGLAELVGPPCAPPAPSLMTLLDVLGGILGAEAAVAGLLLRQRDRTGAAVESSLLSASNTLRRCGVRPQSADRQPIPDGDGWTTGTVAVATDLGDLLTDARFAAVIGRDEFGCPALSTPWRIS
ncbi:CoA transferase [Nocardia sp. CA-151230]|uniref:CoA transferase n=1 Tax=Nocardia sp. CA-151230 TaxID=3239982 RepID=UPI003D8E704D